MNTFTSILLFVCFASVNSMRRREIGAPAPVPVPPLAPCDVDEECPEKTFCDKPCNDGACQGICAEAGVSTLEDFDMSCRSDKDCESKIENENSRCELPADCMLNTEECVGFCQVIVEAPEEVVMMDGAKEPMLDRAKFNEIVPDDVGKSRCLPALQAKMECLATKITVAESIADFKSRMAVCILDEGKCEVSMDLEPFRRRQAASRSIRHNRRQVTEDPIGGAFEGAISEIYNATHSGFAQWMQIKECAKLRLPFDVYEKTSGCLQDRGYPELSPETLEKIQFRGMEKISKFLEAPALIQKSCQNPEAIKTCLTDLLNGVDLSDEGLLLDHICKANDACHIEIPNDECGDEVHMFKQLKMDVCDCHLNVLPEEEKALIKDTLLQCGTESGMSEDQVSMRLQAFKFTCEAEEDMTGEPRPPICNPGYLW